MIGEVGRYSELKDLKTSKIAKIHFDLLNNISMVMSKCTLPLEFGSITLANVEQLRLINLKTLPVRYSQSFYQGLVSNGNPEFLKFAILNGFTVGSVCARVEEADNEKKKLYIMTLTVLPSYRRRGIATSLFDIILSLVIKNSSFIEIYLHVQVSNDEALAFYEHHGFVNVEHVENYYKRIEPPHAYKLRLDLCEYRSKHAL